MFKMQKKNHFAKVYRSSSKDKKKSSSGQLSSADEFDSEESSGVMWLGSFTHRPLVPKLQYKDP